MTGEPETIPARPSRPRIWILPAMVFGLMGLQVALCAAGIYAATNNKSFAVEHDYYSKAVTWDQQQAILKASAALGWNVTMTIGTPDVYGNRNVTLTVNDRTGAPVNGATAEVISFHHARANEIYKGPLPHFAAGRYGGDVPLRRTGNWEFRLKIQRGNELFVHREVRDVH
jgi:hypothetical protein